MDFRRRAMLLLVALCAVVGCRRNQAANRELIEREMRLQEDRIYELEGKLEDAQRELERLRGGSGASSTFGGGFERRTLVDPNCPIDITTGPATGSSTGQSIAPGSSSGTTSAPPTSNALPRVPDTAPPKVELPPGVSAPPFQGAPIMSPPDAQKPEGIPSRGANGQANTPSPGAPAATTPAAPQFKPMSSPKFRSPGTGGRVSESGVSNGGVLPAAPSPVGVAAAPSVAAGVDVAVKNITLNRRSGGWNSDGKPGDDGILVIVEPRNARGDLVPAAGELSIVLIDPALEGDAGRYARWDFAPDDAAALYRPLAVGGTGGLHIELTWPENPPAHSRLKLFARLSTSDGQRLEAQRDITVDVSGGGVARLSPPGGFVEASGSATLPGDASNAPAVYWNGSTNATMSGPALLPAGNAPPAQFGSGGPAAPIWRRTR